MPEGLVLPKVNAVILAYWPQRYGHIQQIVDDLLAGTVVPDRIFILNNHPEHILPPIEGALVVESKFNFECRGKFVFALMDVADYYMLIDDDTTVQPGTLECCMRYAHKGCCFGYLGVNIDTGSFSTGTRLWPQDVGEETPCDAFCGIGMFMAFDALVRILIAESTIRLDPEYGREMGLGDDILAGLANNSSVIPMLPNREQWRELGYEGVAMYWGSNGIPQDRYVADRDRFALDIIRALKEHPIPEF